MPSPPLSPLRAICVAVARSADRQWLGWFLAALTAAAPMALFAQTVSERGDGFLFDRPTLSFAIRGGYDRPFAGSDIYDFATTQLSLDRGDFAAFGYAFDMSVRLADRVDLMFSAGEARRSSPSEFRKFVDTRDRPIQQTTALRRVPLTLGLRYAVTSPGERIGRLAWIPSRFTPWIGLGGGTMRYSFTQAGDFVDFQTLNVFPKTYRSKGWAPMAYANIGAEYSLNERFALTGDLRYATARAPLDGAFVGFDKIDLSGTAATMGFSVRY